MVEVFVCDRPLFASGSPFTVTVGALVGGGAATGAGAEVAADVVMYELVGVVAACTGGLAKDCFLSFFC